VGKNTLALIHHLSTLPVGKKGGIAPLFFGQKNAALINFVLVGK